MEKLGSAVDSGSLFPAGYAADCMSFARMMGEDEEMDLDEVIAAEGSLIRLVEDELTIPTANPRKEEIQEIKIAH
ncbi:unnamed protein product [Sphagnum troendelagicum]|uniref:Uncharacterized protein n=1 Tax=Sphagnum troendelagicum TaxID=128251 RepID=A0ABP0TVT7_9BRYO